ncbi:MAG: glycosyltransferase [Nitrososphaera sp.]|nr:glycosyltransferase [Nitrososphaera sp.]
MKNVLHLIETSGPGGAEKMLISLAENLDRSRYRSYACLLKDGWLKNQLQQLGIETILVPQFRSLDFRWLLRMSRLLKEWSIHVMHAHEFTMNVYGSVLSRMTQTPIIATVHGTNYYWVKWHRRLAYKFVSRQSVMVAVSEHLKRFLREHINVHPDDITVVRNGIDFHRFKVRNSACAIRAELGINGDQPVIGTVGNLYAVKGQIYLLRACIKIAKTFPDFVLLIAGRGEQLCVLKEEARSLGILDNVKFLGFREDVPSLLQVMDVFVLPSVSEGLPLSILEAMALGKPVVASNVGGISEVVKEGTTGYLVPPKDPEALAEKIRPLLLNSRLADELGNSGRKRVLGSFTLDQMIQEYQSLYERGFKALGVGIRD